MRAPWFKLDPSIFRFRVSRATSEELGVFTRLLMAAYIHNGNLPDTPNIRWMAEVGPRMWRRLRPVMIAKGLITIEDGMIVPALYSPQKWGRRPAKAWQRESIARRDGRHCAECGSNDRLEIDHIVPVAKGGRDHLDNLQMLCKPCNASKGARR